MSLETNRYLYLEDSDFITRNIHKVKFRMDSGSDHLWRWRWLEHGSHLARLGRIVIEEFPEVFSDINIPDFIQACLLHDVGKFDIPDDHKNWDHLSIKDRNQLREEHVQHSNEMLKKLEDQCKITFSPVVYEVALNHHEKLDGSGVLQKNSDQISKIVQLITILDKICAMSEKNEIRVYNNGSVHTPKAAFDVLEKELSGYNKDYLFRIKSILRDNKHIRDPILEKLFGKYH